MPKNWEKTYFDWLENIQPWCVSRQLWWGHQIPAWYAPWGAVYVEESEEAAFAAALADGVERGALSAAEAEALADDPRAVCARPSRATTTCSTPGSPRRCGRSRRSAGPTRRRSSKRFYPTSVLVTGFDIIFFWVARMMMMGLHFQQRSPVPRRLHPRPRARREGREDVEVEGQRHRPARPDRPATAPTRCASRWRRWRRRAATSSCRSSRVEGYRNFATKLWNASRFAEMNGCARVAGFDPKAAREPLNRWILGEAAKAVARSQRGDRGLPLQRRRQRRLSLRLERVLRLVPRARQAGAAGRRASPRQGRDAGDHRPCARRGLRDAASVHAVPHRGAVGDQGRGGAAARRRARARRRGRAPTCPSTPPPRRRSAGWSTSFPNDPLGALGNGVPPAAPAARSTLVAPRAGARAPSRAAGAETHPSGSRGSATSPSPTRRRPARCRSSCATRWPRCRSPASSTSPPSARGSTRRSPRSGARSPRSTPSSPTPTSSPAPRRRSSRSTSERREAALARIAQDVGGAERLERI